MSAGRRGSRCSARPRNWRPSRRKLAYRDRLDFRSCGQAPVRNGFTLASLCRCGVPSGDFGIGVVTQGSDRPLDKALWAEIEIDEIAAYTIAQTLPEPMANSAIRKRQAKGSRVSWADHSLRAGPPRNDRYLREGDGWSRRLADVAGRDYERPNWADSGPSAISRCNGKNAQIAAIRRWSGEWVKSALS
jgi:hypothetical protein